MNECTGQERHRHYSLYTKTFYTHSHSHRPRDEEFEPLHHHSPIEHSDFTSGELTADAKDTGKGLEGLDG